MLSVKMARHCNSPSEIALVSADCVSAVVVNSRLAHWRDIAEA